MSERRLEGFHWHPEAERKKPFFVEWVYFKFFAAEAEGIIIYGSAWGMPGVLSAQIFRRGQPPARVVRHDFGLGQVWRSTQSYDCRIDRSAITSVEGGHQVSGSISDFASTISWDLSFQALYPSLLGFDAVFGPLRSRLGWKIIAPLAEVRGTVAVNGETLEVEGKGYGDTNYGRWLFAVDPTTHWTWMLGFDDRVSPPLTLVGMNLRRRPTLGALFVLDGQEVLRFPCREETFDHHRFVRDQETGAWFPARTSVRAADSVGHRLDVTAVSEAAFIYRQAIPPKEMRGPLPTILEWTLSEGFVSIEGSLSMPDGTRRPVSARGIREYPVTRLAYHE